MNHRVTVLIGIIVAASFLTLLIPQWDAPGLSQRVPALAAVNRQLNRLLPWRKNVSGYLVEAGQEMRRRNDVDRTLQMFEGAVRIAPRSPAAWEALLDMQVQQNNVKEAKTAAKRLKELDPHNPTLLSFEAYDLASRGKVEEAIAAYRRGKALTSRDITMLLNQQKLLVQAKQLDRAEWLTQQASLLLPEEDSFDNNLAWYYQQRNVRLPVALRHARKALQINPEDANSRDTLAWVYLKLGKIEESIDEARRVIAAKPVSESEILLGIIASRQGRLDEAVEHFRKGFRIGVHDPQVRRLAEAEIERIEPKLSAEQKKLLHPPGSRVRRKVGPMSAPPGAPDMRTSPPPETAAPIR